MALILEIEEEKFVKAEGLEKDLSQVCLSMTKRGGKVYCRPAEGQLLKIVMTLMRYKIEYALSNDSSQPTIL